jgi:hypothetical protein
MGNILTEIIKLNNGLFLLNRYDKKSRKISKYISLIIFLMILYFITTIYISYRNYKIINIDGDILYSLLVLILTLVIYIFFAFYIKEIFININEQKIIFKYGFLSLRKIRIIDINELKEISINNTSGKVGRYVTLNGIVNYNVDLIDKNLNAYRLYQSRAYNNDLIIFAKRISEIINIELVDKNNVEGYKNIFKKIVI